MTRTELHRLVDELPDDAVESAGRLLLRAADPMTRALAAAPVDDEPESASERAESDKEWKAYLRGESVPLSALD